MLLENMPDGFACFRVITDEEGQPHDFVFIDINSAFSSLTGFSREQLMDQPLSQILDRTSLEKREWINRFSRAVLREKTIPLDHHFKLGGRVFSLTIYGQDPGHLALIMRDITRSQEDREQLRERDEQLQLIINSLTDVVEELDSAGAWTYLSPAAEDVLGRGEELIGRSAMEFIHPDDQPELKAVLDREPETGEKVQKEYRYLHPQRGYIWLESRGNTYKNRDGEMRYLFNTRDISSRKKAQQEVRESEARFQRMLGLLPDMISIHDRDMNIIYSNWKGFGQVPPEKRKLNTKCYRTYRGYDEICPDCKARQVFETREAFQKETELPDGTWVDLRVIPILDRQGEVELFVEWVRDITAEKEIRKDLLEQKNLLEGIINGTQDMLAIQNPDLTLQRINKAGYEMLGVTSEELGSRKCYELVGRDQPCKTCATRRAQQSGELEQVEKFFPELGIHVACRSNPILDEAGNVKWVVEQLRDITEEKKREDRLRTSENRLRTITESTLDGVLMIDASGNINFWNPAVEKLLGYKREEVLGQNLHQLLAPDRYQEEYQRAFPHFQKTGSGKFVNRTVELEACSREGQEIPVEISLAAFELKDGWHAVAIMRDIRKRREVEEKLRLNSLVLDQIKDNVIITDLEGNISYVNEATAKMLGRSREEFLGKHTEVLGEDPQEGPTQQEILEKVREKGFWRGEVINYTREGQKLVMDSRIQVVRNEQGETIALCGISTNITASKQYEKKLQYLSFHDSLTGVYNRAFLEEEMQRLDTEKQLPLSIIMVDVNGLKLINDSYGRGRGDEMLRHTASILKKVCSEEDIIARWGGDEFVILLPQTPLRKANQISRRIMTACNNQHVKETPISVSLGVGSKIKEEKELAGVLKQAEDSMYRHKLTVSRSARSAVLEALLKTLAAKSFETEAHTRRMQEVARAMGQEMGMADGELNQLSLLITLHDIGKINIPEEILTKEGPLNKKEWELIKKHPETGYRIAQGTPEFAHVAEDILAHHEHWNGNGYPRGLRGTEIPLLARITAIADAYEVMSNGRPYKEPMGRKEIITEFKKCAGEQFDPELIRVFLEVMGSGE